jgi:hypothetical protein
MSESTGLYLKIFNIGVTLEQPLPQTSYSV